MINDLRLKCLYRVLSLITFTIIVTTLTGCNSTSCEQDYPPPFEITTSDNPYNLSFYSTDLSISSARWENITTGESGIANISQIYECIFPLGCGDWTHVEMYVPLTTGTNTVYTYETSDGCEWRSDYLITYN